MAVAPRRGQLRALVSVLVWAPGVGASRLRAEGRPDNSSDSAPHSVESFAAFVALHGRQYRPGSLEYWRRQSLFEERKGEAAQQNALPGRLWSAGLNALSDWTEEELQQLRGYRPGASGTGGGTSGVRVSVLSANRRSGKVGPSQDWRRLPVLQKPRDQSHCGSCWAIAAAVLVEAYAQKSQPADAETPSVQQLVSCVPNPRRCGGDGGCKGATMDLALDYALSHNISSEAQWSYNAITGPLDRARCPTSNTALQMLNGTAAARNGTSGEGMAKLASAANTAAHSTAHALSGVMVPFKSYAMLPRNQYTPLLEALYESGPVGVSVAASGWFSYHSGIFDNCTGDKGAVIDHAVVAVAFGEQAGTKYWTLMNSWGYNWGENGYIRLLRRDADDSHCAMNHDPKLGTACMRPDGSYPAQEKVCGMCGILFDSILPLA